jgi:hypothetical protein
MEISKYMVIISTEKTEKELSKKKLRKQNMFVEI